MSVMRWPGPARLAAVGVFAATAIGTICLAWGGREEAPAMPRGRGDQNMQLFGGWIQPGSAELNPDAAERLARAPQPKWVLATEPSNDEIRDLQSALADHPDKAQELDRLIEHSRFRKQVALWNELREDTPGADASTDNERASLGQHLLAVLPAHYGRGELLAPQALTMARALIKDLEHDPSRQSALLAQARSQLQRQVPRAAAGTEAPVAGLDDARHALLSSAASDKTP